MAIAMAQQYEIGESGFPVSSPSGYYTMVPNAFFDALVPQLAPQQVVIACWILRQTIGWDREWSPAVGYRRLGEEANLDKMTVMRHVQAGLKGGWLDRQGSGTSFEYRISGWLDGSLGKQQPLNGNFTKVPHSFFENLVPNLDPVALKVCCWIIRQTMGWSREWTNSVSYDRLAKLTGLSRSAVIRHLQSLQKQRLIERVTTKGAGQYRLSHPTTWVDQFKRRSPPLSNERPGSSIHSGTSQAYAERHSSSVCAQTLEPYAERDDDRMRRDTGSPPAKERKERYRRTTTKTDNSSFPSNDRKEGNTRHICDQGVIVSLDRVRQNVSELGNALPQASRKQPPISSQDREKRLAAIAGLDLQAGAKDTLVRHFPVEVLQQGMAWLATASNLNDLGRAFYAACRDGYKPLRSFEDAASEDRTWARETFGHLDGATVCGQRVDLARSGVEISGEGSTRGPEVIGFGLREFRSRLQERMDRLLKAKKDKVWIEEILQNNPADSAASPRIHVSENYVTYTVGEGSQSRMRVLQYGAVDFRAALAELLGLSQSVERL